MPESLTHPRLLISYSDRDERLGLEVSSLLEYGLALPVGTILKTGREPNVIIEPFHALSELLKRQLDGITLAVFLVSKHFLHSTYSVATFGACLSRSIESLIFAIPPLRRSDVSGIFRHFVIGELTNKHHLFELAERVAKSLGLNWRHDGIQHFQEYLLRFLSTQKVDRMGRPAYENACMYPIWYATNRAPSEDDTMYTSGRSEGGVTYYGKCVVAIPRWHQIGSIGSPWWKRLITRQDDRLEIHEHTRFDATEFWESTRQQLVPLAEDERTALVFIHGYNVSFRRATLRAAQIGADLKVPLTMLFSWPSKGLLKEYLADVAAIEASEDQICEFLEELLRRSGAERVHLLVHSMGNQGLLRSFQELGRRAATALKLRFGQIFLAAPDVDTDVFGRRAGPFVQIAQRTTMYASSHDKALASAGILYGAPRAGYAPPITIVPGIDTIEVSAVDLSRLGHGYVASARSVLSDIHILMQRNDPPDKRIGLTKWQAPNGTYWRIQG